MSLPTFDTAVAKLIPELTTAFGVIPDDKAAAFFPGIAVDHQIVQQGAVNPLRLAQWLATFDTTMVLRPGQAIETVPPGGANATTLYATVVNGARAIDPTSAAGLQLAGRIAAARGLLEQVVVEEPLGAEPPDWPLPTTLTWQASSSTAEKVPPPPPDENPPNTVVRMPDLGAANAGQGDPLLLTWFAEVGDPVTAGKELAIAANTKADVDILSPATGTLLKIITPGGTAVPTGTGIAIVGPAPPDAELVVTLEHATFLLTRRAAGSSWWDDVLLTDRTWFIPGRTAGGLLPAPMPGMVNAVPYSVLMVRNVVVENTGATAPAGDPGWPAMQAIGVLATVLPPLPPLSDPALPASALVTVPDFTQLMVDDAKPVADASELDLSVVPGAVPDASRVIQQSPPPGAQVARGSVVSLATSSP